MNTQDKYNLTDEDYPETFEYLMQINHMREEEERLNNARLELMAKIEVDKKIWDAVESITGREYSPEQRKLEQLSFDVKCQAFDMAFGKEGALIQPSHSFMPFSLINNRDLRSYIPETVKSDKSNLLDSLLKDSAVRSLEVIRDYTSENTKRAFNGDIVYWQAWLSAIGFNFNTDKITVNILKHFIIQHIEEMNPQIDKILVEQRFKSKLGTHSLETVKRRIASLSVCLDLDKLDNPCRDEEVKLLLKRFTRMYGGKGKKKKAITKDILEDMILTCGRHLIDVRDKAILFFAFSSGGRRRCEVIDADMANLTETSEGDYLYNLCKSKTNQTGEDDYKPIKGKAAKALRDWLEASGIKEGPIFRSIGKGGDIRGGLSGNDIRRIVKKRAKLAGYDDNQFSAHSLRRGFITEGAKQGKPIGDIMKMTSHKSVSTAMKYYEAGNIINNSCSELVG
jgi:integrase